MTYKRESRTPGKVHGSTSENPKAILRAHTASPRNDLTWHDWQVYERASTSVYMAGEPVELTRARDELDSWRLVVADLNAQGLTPILAHHVWRALRYGGWLQ